MAGAEIRRLFGKNLKRIRLQQGLSQFQLSIETGLTHNFINDIEKGDKWLSSESFGKLISALNVAPHCFFLSEGGANLSANADPYLIDFSDSLQKMAHELQQRYGTELTKPEATPDASPAVADKGVE
ncbi:MAG: helix-turn-helix domain-containing protein [Treponema sp.]|jgi:transcriptional regulator with XRE-family HTH domain|nr:helix-turn-helix domain-containing protein [Treponema sp.]